MQQFCLCDFSFYFLHFLTSRYLSYVTSSVPISVTVGKLEIRRTFDGTPMLNLFGTTLIALWLEPLKEDNLIFVLCDFLGKTGIIF